MESKLKDFDKKLASFVHHIAENKENLNGLSWKKQFARYLKLRQNFDHFRQIITLDNNEEQKYIYLLNTVKTMILQHT